MKSLLLSLALMTVAAGALAQPAVTIYNQNFAVVRDVVPLDLKVGTNQVRFAEATANLEPSSVMLRDPAGRRSFQVLEQSYRNDPISQQTLLALNEGKTIQFEIVTTEAGQTRRERVPGKIIRAGYVYAGEPTYYGGYSGGTQMEPLVEMGGSLRFGLPGVPIFPNLADDTVLKPTLHWILNATETLKVDAELSYVTGEMSWECDYNLALPERADTLDFLGWVTIDNRSGKSFQNARVKLMAGDVSKVQDRNQRRGYAMGGFGGGGGGMPPTVTEKSFDEYHLYTLERPVTFRDREKKQVEFVRAADVGSRQIYVYDGATPDPDQPQWWDPQQLHTEAEYGSKSYKKIWAFREFTNSVANHLGIPLPKGKIRIYRRNTDRQLEFVGENLIKHTPRNEVVRLYTGNAFDLVGERKRTDLRLNISGGAAMGIDPATGLPVPGGQRIDAGPPWVDESFEITLRNHKTEAVEIRVVEHLYRHINWDVTAKSEEFQKTDAQTIEFRLKLEQEQERKVTYKVHYTW